ncbi:MAG TPA: alpha/beta hydrolase [Myxococcota bacterium]|jgi:pimeloyl-ACP methyl ester carboxylesterase
MSTTPTTGYATTQSGARIYFESHASDAPGQTPLVLLHGSFGGNDTWSAWLPGLTKTRPVIAVELRGHAHSDDVDGPLSYEAMADDVAAVLAHLQVARADVLGYSLGATVAAGVALRHPEQVRKLVMVSGVFDARGYEPQTRAAIGGLPAEFAPPPLVDAYQKAAPDKSRWPSLVAKIKALITGADGFSDRDIQALAAPLLLIMGDRDGFRIERALEVSRMVKRGQLAVIPGADHFFVFTRADLVASLATTFLDADP